MTVRLLAFGIAKDILKTRSMAFELQRGNSVADLKTALIAEYADFKQLAKLSFAVNENYVHNDYVLQEGDEVVLIPPVSGG